MTILHQERATRTDMAAPLHDVTFVVVDVETTGASPRGASLTEIAAAKFRGGECLGTLQTLVDPACPIPPRIAALTGITDDMVGQAPSASAVLPALLEFSRGAVVVGHNVRFDLAFVNAALERTGGDRLSNVAVDTLILARRLLRGEVPDCRLGTLAAVLDLDHRPSHRALDDVLSTGDLLHRLIEEATGFGVLALADLVAFPVLARHPQAAKLRLTCGLPDGPGAYWFEDHDGAVFHSGEADSIRARVRSYFSPGRGRKVARLLRDLHRVGHERRADDVGIGGFATGRSA
jgi:DNA polymerase III subunit epsilon